MMMTSYNECNMYIADMNLLQQLIINNKQWDILFLKLMSRKNGMDKEVTEFSCTFLRPSTFFYYNSSILEPIWSFRSAVFKCGRRKYCGVASMQILFEMRKVSTRAQNLQSWTQTVSIRLVARCSFWCQYWLGRAGGAWTVLRVSWNVDVYSLADLLSTV